MVKGVLGDITAKKHEKKNTRHTFIQSGAASSQLNSAEVFSISCWNWKLRNSRNRVLASVGNVPVEQS